MKLIKIHISAKARYMPNESAPDSKRFIWSYEIKIENQSEEIVQLLNRYWRITDMTARVEEVRGPGVVGLQPIIKPGKEFVYNSFCQLMMPQGTMEGYYEMQTLDEVRFRVEIPKFVLAAPGGVTPAHRAKLH